MLSVKGETTWADFNCTEVGLNALENMNFYDIVEIPQTKMVLIVHCLCAMLRKLGREEISPYKVSELDKFSYLSECSHGRLREIVKFLIDEFPDNFTQTPVNEKDIVYNHCGND